MKILVAGSDARANALEWKFTQEGHDVLVAPGNGGTRNNVSIRIDDIKALARFAMNEGCVTVVSPEEPLVKGIVDFFERFNLPIFGPNSAAARLEGSKIIAKIFMKENGIQTPDFIIVKYPFEIKSALKRMPPPYVVKASGLCGGKGVTVHDTAESAERKLTDILRNKVPVHAGGAIVERFLEGTETSYFVLTDGKVFAPLRAVRDYKKLNDGDKGDNTGGMGSYTPHGIVDQKMERKIIDNVIKPTIRGLRRRGILYKGVMYAGLMIVNNEPMVLEYNVRFGDPEAANLVTTMRSELSLTYKHA